MPKRAPLKGVSSRVKQTQMGFWVRFPLLLAMIAAGITALFIFLLYIRNAIIFTGHDSDDRTFVVANNEPLKTDGENVTTTTVIDRPSPVVPIVSSEETIPSMQELSGISVEVRNGTRSTGLARTLGDRLKLLGYAVSSPVDAVRRDYPTTIIAISSTHTPSPSVLRQLELIIGGQVQELPLIEGKQSADVVIIIGKDFTK